jgi:hypothetical protein
MQTGADAEFMFEAAKYIFKDPELQTFRKLTTLQEKQHFLRNFWLARNPIAAASVNLRALEHFRRLLVAEASYWFYGARSWFNNPKKTGYKNLELPKVYFLNDEFNDKGLIYIRHGEPNDRAFASGQMLETFESWRYNAKDDRPELIFHFVMNRNAVENNWRMTPFPLEPQQLDQLIFGQTSTLYNDVSNSLRILAELTGWSPKLDRFIMAATQGTRARMEFSNVAQQVIEEGTESMYLGLSSDYHSWDRKIKFFEFPFTLVNYRDSSGKTRTEINYAIPLDKVAQKKQETRAIEFEHGVAIFDTLGHEHGKFNERVSLNKNKSKQVFKNNYIDRKVFDLEPGTYQLSLYAEAQAPPRIGGWNIRVDIPSFGNESLSLSGLELAFDIVPGAQNTVFDKQNLSVIPNPTNKFDLNDTVYLYFEIYNLKKDEGGETSFEIENKLKQLKKKKGGLKKLFGAGEEKRKKSISIKASRQGKDETSIEYTSFDISRLEPGEYELSVRVKDLNSGQMATRSINVTLSQIGK